ncbi:MAG TPA: recombinase family protein, partial [Ktedonobacterales bacterium]
LGLRAAYAEIEREQIYMRMQRGRRDRIEIGKAPNGHSKCAYGYVFVDTEREVKGRYELNNAIVHVDSSGKEWTEWQVVQHIFELLKKGESLAKVTVTLNNLGIPTPMRKNRKGQDGKWLRGTIYLIADNPIYMGMVYANRYKFIKNPRSGKMESKPRPREEWIPLPEGIAPPIIDRSTFEAIQQQLAINKQESLRNNHHPRKELGLLRAGYIFCGVCNRRMQVRYPSLAYQEKTKHTSQYACYWDKGFLALQPRHRTQIHLPFIDGIVLSHIRELVQNTDWVRARVAELRKTQEPTVSAEELEQTLEGVRRSMRNLYVLAEQATDDDTLAALTQRMNELEKTKRELEGMLYSAHDVDESAAKLEEERVKFEKWAADVRPYLSDHSYTPSYAELRLAVRILGIKAVVYPTKGEWPFRYQIEVSVPEIMRLLHCVNVEGCAYHPPHTQVANKRDTSSLPSFFA